MADPATLTEESAKSDEDVITLAKERFAACSDFWEPLYRDAIESLKFSLGEQWPDELRRLRENDPDGSRPCLVVDKLGQYVRQVVNNARQNKPAIKPRPVNDGADEEVAEILEGLIRHIEVCSKADIAYDTGADFAVRGGVGYVRIRTDYLDDESLDQEILIEPVNNPFQVYMEPPIKDTDGADAEYGFVFEDIPKRTFKKLYPNAKEVDFGDKGNDGWVTEETIRVAEYFCTVYETKTISITPSGASEEDVPNAKKRQLRKKRVVWRKMTGVEVLEEADWPSQYIGIVPCWGRLTNINGKWKLQSLISPAIDAQRMHNYAASSVMERACLAPKAKYMAPVQSTEGLEDQWRKANTSNNPLLNYNHVDDAGNQMPAPQLQPGPDVPAAWVNLLNMTEHDIQASLGMYAENLGQQTNATSGRAINARKQQGELATFDFSDNQSRMIRQVGRVVLSLIPKIYDTRRIVQIVAEDGEHDTVQLDPDLDVPLRSKEGDDVIKRIFNPNLGKYDITVTAGSSFATKRMEAVDWMTQMMQANPAAGALLADLQVKAMDLPYADIAAKRFKAMLPPQVQQIENAPEDIPPQAQQQIMQMTQAAQQAHQIIQHLEQQLQAANQQLQSKQTDFALKAQELQVKDKEVSSKVAESEASMHESADQIQIDWYQAETARIDAETRRLQALIAAREPIDTAGLVQQTVQQVMDTPLDSLGPQEAIEEHSEDMQSEGAMQ